jgi:hypothetical protein
MSPTATGRPASPSLWGLELGTAVAALVAGHWTRTLRRVAFGGSIAWLVLLVWWVAAGPIFVSEQTDGVTKLCLLAVAVFVVIDVMSRLRRLMLSAEKSKRVPKLGA